MKPIHCYQYMVELTTATLNTPPQVDGLLERLSGPPTTDRESSGPSWRSGAAAEFTVEDTSSRTARPIRQRLSPVRRSALVAAFAAGAKQKDLALQYGVSIRSVKRLVRSARQADVIT
jgi:DNA-directed RNA polymerase specialized sigma24 family protein